MLGCRWLASCRWVESRAIANDSLSWMCSRGFHGSCVALRVQAGKYKPTQYRTRGLTFEQALNPSFIGMRKTWNSWNTSSLKDVNSHDQTAQMTIWDTFIRKFVTGTWHNVLVSEVIIKRRHNAVFVSAIVAQTITARKMYFLIGYTEELLSFLLKCPVKLEMQSVKDRKDVIHTYV